MSTDTYDPAHGPDRAPHSDSAGHPDSALHPNKEERTWAMAAHAASPAAMILSGGALGWVAPLVIWLAKRGESPFIADQAKEALNFQITMFVIYIGLVLFTIVFGVVTFGLGAIPGVLAIGLMVVIELILGIVAAMKSYDGAAYRYPFNWRVL